jgi:hypothetical protein
VTTGRKEIARKQGISNCEHVSPIEMEKIGGRNQSYGDTPGQLGAMEGGFEGVVSSPPYEGSIHDPATRSIEHKAELLEAAGIDAERWLGEARCTQIRSGDYGDSEGQVGSMHAETFWGAACTIVEQTYALLKPGAHAIFVVKRFVRDKEVVDFPGQWAQLCESVGFRLVHWHRAWLVEHNGVQLDMFGNEIEKTVARKSFFRRLYESKYPENSIDWEDVLCMVKPRA